MHVRENYLCLVAVDVMFHHKCEQSDLRIGFKRQFRLTCNVNKACLLLISCYLMHKKIINI